MARHFAFLLCLDTLAHAYECDGAGDDCLDNGDELDAGQQLMSNDGRIHLDMQADGDLVLWQTYSGALWTAGTSGVGNYLAVEEDGTMVIYTKDGGVAWTSDTGGQGCNHLQLLQDGCDMAMVNDDDDQCWRANTGGCSPAPSPSPPVPSPPPTALPVFYNSAALQQSPWGSYFVSLYGSLPRSYPLEIEKFWCFYSDKLQAHGISLPPSVGKCPTAGAPEGQHYDENNMYSSKDLTWLWHLSCACYEGFDSNSLVEVSHAKDPFGDEHYGMWFVYAKGSGVWLNVGSTKIFDNHEDAFKFFGAKTTKAVDINEDMCQKATAAGFDTVQFIKHDDDVNYPCAKPIGVPWMNMEIVAVSLTGTYACGSAQGTPSSLRAGWHGEKPCKCDPSNPNTNCVFSFSNDAGNIV